MRTEFLGYDPCEDAYNVLCPECIRTGGSENPHIESVQVVQGPKITTITPGKVNDWEDPTGRSHSGRGSQVRVRYFCECGHRFEHCIAFHKGSVSLSLNPIPYCGELSPSELWRD